MYVWELGLEFWLDGWEAKAVTETGSLECPACGSRCNIDYLLRTAQQHHVHLSSMADNKAHILIGATLVIQTLVVSEMARSGLHAELLVLSLFSFFATIFACCAIFPSLRVSQRFDPGDESFNPLFFGHFAAMSQDEYVHHMLDLLQDGDRAYRMILRDLYQIGRVLRDTKYRYIRWSYFVFLSGLAGAFVLFLGKLAAGSSLGYTFLP